MIFLTLAWKSLASRRLATTLTALSIALSVALLLSVERARRSAEDGFNSAVSQVDLLVGARTSPLHLMLSTVFGTGNATHNVSWETYLRWKNHAAVEWTIPYSLGDGHRGFRVVATDGSFFEHYRFRRDLAVEFTEGHAPADLWDVAIGSEVAKTLRYGLGQAVVLSHGAGAGESFHNHSDRPFHVSGIIRPTGTPIDRALYIGLEAMEALHVHADGKAEEHGGHEDHHEHADLKKEDIKPDELTAFFVRARSRVDTLRLQREINDDAKEPLLAVIPGVALQDLWKMIGDLDRLLKAISVLVVAVSFAAMMIALTTTLNERRREMAILRSLGAGGGRILGLLLFEAGLLTVGGLLIGIAIHAAGFALLAPWLEREYGLFIAEFALGSREVAMLLALLVAGLVSGLLPALRAQRQVLRDGLSIS